MRVPATRLAFLVALLSMLIAVSIVIVTDNASGQRATRQQQAADKSRCVKESGDTACRLQSQQQSSPESSAPPTVTPSPQPTAPSPQPTGLQPDGVPSALVGSLVLDDSGASLLNSWGHTILAGADCNTQGTVAPSGSQLTLGTNGTTGSCAEITSNARYTFGIFEARIWAQAAPNGLFANWPGFWLLGQNWPVDGEIDGFEGLHGYDSASFHYGTSNSYFSQRDTALSPGWNVVDIVWKPQMLAIYYNGQKFVEWDSAAITSQPMAVMFDTLTGPYGYTTGQPSTLQVDYLRIWTAA